MIKELIQDIKSGAVNSGNNLLMDKSAFKEFLFEQTQKKPQEQDKLLIINEFEKLSDSIKFENLEPINLDFQNNMFVNEIINCFIYLCLTVYIVNEVLKTTNTEPLQFNIN